MLFSDVRKRVYEIIMTAVLPGTKQWGNCLMYILLLSNIIVLWSQLYVPLLLTGMETQRTSVVCHGPLPNRDRVYNCVNWNCSFYNMYSRAISEGTDISSFYETSEYRRTLSHNWCSPGYNYMINIAMFRKRGTKQYFNNSCSQLPFKSNVENQGKWCLWSFQHCLRLKYVTNVFFLSQPHPPIWSLQYKWGSYMKESLYICRTGNSVQLERLKSLFFRSYLNCDTLLQQCLPPGYQEDVKELSIIQRNIIGKGQKTVNHCERSLS